MPARNDSPTAEAPAFDPAAHEVFRYLDWELDPAGPRVLLRYALGDEHHFEEEIRFPGGEVPSDPAARDSLERAIRLLHLVAGVSYWKAAASPVVAAVVLPGWARDFLTTLYRHGMAEFAHENGLALDRPVRFAARTITTAAPPRPLALPRRTAVPVGGGKDSIVTIEALKAAGEPLVLFTVGDFPAMRATVREAGLERIAVERRLSPELFALNAAGAYNGHVPVTAIVSSIACVAALLYGFDAIAMSNERSASAGNVVVDGVEVNHQWSKGAAFEDAFREVLRDHVFGGALDWFSFLRPAPELAIGRAFAGLKGYHRAFTSCNAAFRIDPAARGGAWCCDCPKCRFVFLVLAPFMAPADLSAIFGANLLDDPAQVEGFDALLGVGGAKPFECVGEVEESAAAFALLAEQDAWRDAAVVRHVAALGLPRSDPARYLRLDPEDHLAPRFAAALGAMLS